MKSNEILLDGTVDKISITYQHLIKDHSFFHYYIGGRKPLVRSHRYDRTQHRKNPAF